MKIRSKAPLRIGLAGGGTDVSPYSDIFNGAILNATINLYAYCTIIPKHDSSIIFRSLDDDITLSYLSKKEIPTNEGLIIQKGVYNRIIKDFNLEPLSFEMNTSIDVPSGSGLGSSSTLVVAIIGAFVEWLNLPLGEYDIAKLAYSIEREDLNMRGGKQDQYATTFGGFNFMEFYSGNKVVVNPLNLKQEVIDELEMSLVLYYTSTRRESSNIIEEQVKNTKANKEEAIDAMHEIKKHAFSMKEILLTKNLEKLGLLLHENWESKKKMAKAITNNHIDEIYKKSINAGATGGKISGAGGGGFMILYCPDKAKYDVIQTLRTFGGEVKNFQFTKEGVKHWTIN